MALVATGAVVACLTVPASADPLASPSVTSTTGAPSGTGATTTPTASTASTTTTTSGGGGSGAGNVLIPNRSIAHAGTALNGAGSSFAAPAIETFQKVVFNPPYGLNINYTSTSSGDGRYEFTNGTTDFAVSDIAYGLGGTDSSPPTFPYIYVPITAGGIAFMYNIPGLSKNLQLSSYSTCGILTGGITNWNDSNIAKDNPGLSLPNLPIVPVTESDPAGTNYVLEEWCIAEQPALWAAFANKENASNPPVVINATSPQSEWPPLANGRDTTSTAAVTGNVSTTAGAIGGVQ
ncbi:MAG TPA: substrate-binding domain-containing protein, partial [Acidimicrobiales bacterium]|nr:substrate-binding domain-containing protein [Acidimicrobiales bacterium]